MKEVLSIEVGENESNKYWLGVLNSLKNRGVQDILILCSDGLTKKWIMPIRNWGKVRGELSIMYAGRLTD